LEAKKAVAIRMRTTLLVCLLSVSFGVIALTLTIVHNVLQKQVRRDISADLERSISTLRNIQAQRQEMLSREVSLLAALPVLKSLMTTSDERTIRDGAADFYELSGGDLFALADGNGKPVAVYEGGASRDSGSLSDSVIPGIHPALQPMYVMVRGNLFEVAVQPLYFGAATSGTRLGYVLLGYSVDRRLAEEVSQATSAEVIFYADKATVATTLDDRYKAETAKRSDDLLSTGAQEADTWFGGEHFVHAAVLLSGTAEPRVQLVVLKSYDQASRYVTHLNQVLIVLGVILLLLSGALAVYLSMTITRPLDRLVAGARALGGGNFDYQLQRAGAREIRELGDAFDRMRTRLRAAREELVAAERLATIGQMASSISHDLRHYLSAVYANAEFLGYGSIGPDERLDLLSEIRQGVRGMTDLIDSLLLFSRTGQSLQLSFESLPFLAERAIAMVHAHPDAQNVHIAVDPMPQMEGWTDARKIERAIYNLLLNACQAARQGSGTPEIRIALSENAEQVLFSITDNGPGVPETIRESLFQPFVSVGKPSGTGLGLTLAQKIAQEHGGSVILQESRPDRTVFQFSIAKGMLRKLAETAQKRETAATPGGTDIHVISNS
jgi:signal transduction histidine kinase